MSIFLNCIYNKYDTTNMIQQMGNYKFGSRSFRWISLGGILICFLLYFWININLTDDTGEEVMEDYFVNTLGCQIQALNPFSKKALSFYQRFGIKKCFKPQLLSTQTIRGKNYLVLSMPQKDIINFGKVERISDILCECKTMKRYGDDANQVLKSETFRLSNKLEQILVGDGPIVLRVQCFSSKNISIYHDVHFFLPAPPKRRSPKTTSRPDRISVMILGIDSISHMHYLRSMPALNSYIRSLAHIEFWGYNRVGRNSYPNLVPLLSGLDESELEKTCYNDQGYDSCDFLWKHFKASGYKTSYAEDTRVGGTFNYGKLGFHKPPTDFYLRPVMLEVDKHTRYSIDIKEEIHCSAARRYSEILQEYLYKLIPHLKQESFFSFSWQTQGVHDYFNYAQAVDLEYLKFFQHLTSHGLLNNTLILLMSDHGIRFGAFRSSYQGMLEESQPLLIALYPRWLEEAYPLAISNLWRNAHSLITTFDLHATLKDLTNLKLLRNDYIERRSVLLKGLGRAIPRGINLFLPIPEFRDCALAAIPSSYCLCQNFSQIEISDDRSQLAARFVVDSINGLIGNYKLCQRLELKEVHAAYLVGGSDDQSQFEVKACIQTTPGEGRFEGTVRFLGNSLLLNGPVLRTNKYGNQSFCVNNFQIEMYCYCLTNV